MPAIPYRLAAIATSLAAAAALAGLVLTGLYVDAPDWAQQARGTDLATLFLAVPVLVVGLWTASPRLLGRSPRDGGRVAVSRLQLRDLRIRGGAEPAHAVHIAILGLSLWSLLLAGRAAVERTEGLNERLDRRVAGGLLVGVAALFGLLWLGQIATASTTGILPPDLIEAGISSNPVYALDLAFFLPLCALAGVGLWRRTSAAAFAFPMLIWVALMGAGVVGGFVLIAAAGDQIVVPVVVAIGGLSVARVDPGRGCPRPTRMQPAALARPPLAPYISKDERHADRRTPDRGRRRLRRRPFRDGLHQLERRRERRFVLFPYATDAPTRWVFGSLDGMLGLLVPVMIGLAAIAVLSFFLAFFATLGIWVPTTWWRPSSWPERSVPWPCSCFTRACIRSFRWR